MRLVVDRVTDRDGCREPRVLLVTRNLPPLLGGMERLNKHLAEALLAYGQLTVIGPTGCSEHLPSGAKVIEMPAQPVSRFLFSSFLAAWMESKSHFDFVFAGSGLTVPCVRLAARRSGALSVAYVHGLDLVAEHPLYKIVWRRQLRKLDYAIANSSNTANIAAELGVAVGKVEVIHPGVTIPTVDNATGRKFRKAYGFGDRPILLSVGRLTERKGLSDFVRHTMPIIRKRFPDVLLLVVGNEAPAALAGSAIGGQQRIRDDAERLGLDRNLKIIGTLSDEQLSWAYFAADVHVFPVKELAGDIEGFGMVAVEAAAHGLYTVAFAVGGVPDAVSNGVSGYLVDDGEYESMAERVCDALQLRISTGFSETATEFARRFEWRQFELRLHGLLDSLIGKELETRSTESA